MIPFTRISGFYDVQQLFQLTMLNINTQIIIIIYSFPTNFVECCRQQLSNNHKTIVWDIHVSTYMNILFGIQFAAVVSKHRECNKTKRMNPTSNKSRDQFKVTMIQLVLEFNADVTSLSYHEPKRFLPEMARRRDARGGFKLVTQQTLYRYSNH